MSNRTILEKADIAVSDLANGGVLNEEQANAFIRKLNTQPTLLARIRQVTMNSPIRQVNKLHFASRILRAGTQGGSKVVLDDSTAAKSRSKTTHSQIKLITDEVIAEVRLPYDVIEDNIERGNIGNHQDVGGTSAGGGMVDTIMDLIAERAILDLEELAILGDTGSADPFLALTDGFLTRFTTNVTDASSAAISRAILTDGMKTLPMQYRRNRVALAHMVSTENEIDYRETLAARETSVGDAQLQSTAPVFAAGAPVVGVGLMPHASGLLTHPLNLLWGIQRQISVETDKDISAREYIIVLTARVAFAVEEEEAGVLYTNFG